MVTLLNPIHEPYCAFIPMKKTLRNIFLVAALSPFLTQCATQDEVQRLQYQLHVVNKKLEDMQSNTVGDIQKRQAASSNQIDQLENEILVLRSQLEETNHLNRSLKEQNKELATSIGTVAKEEAERRNEALKQIELEQAEKEARIAELTEKLTAQQESLQAIQDSRVREAERRAKDARTKADSARAKALAASSATGTSSGTRHIAPVKSKRIVSSDSDKAVTEKPVATKTTATPAPKVTTPAATPNKVTTAPAISKSTSKPVTATSDQQQTVQAPAPATPSPMAAANQLYSQKNYPKAYAEFDKIASANPASDDGVTAGFMMGECLYAQKEYDKAILQYQKIISQNGTHPKAASATLKQAMAFELLADNETARMIYKKIINHYGSSPEAAVAKEKLGNL